jgi:hypothetical protein
MRRGESDSVRIAEGKGGVIFFGCKIWYHPTSTNASRTLLMNFETLGREDDLLKITRF